MRTNPARGLWRTAVGVISAAAVITAVVVASPLLTSPAGAVAAGAAFTTYDSGQGGCLHGSGVNCNTYRSHDDVYMSGGPASGGASLSDGSYFFAVIEPGSQNTGWADGAAGNLSDLIGSGDAVSNRTFTVTGGQIDTAAYITGGGTHATGTSPNGRNVIGLSVFDTTSNPGGVYILAVCQTGATSASQCKFDAFKAPPAGTTCQVNCVTPFGVLSGGKYYDANANGRRDATEVGIANWPIHYTDGVSGTFFTDATGLFSQEFTADTYTLAESAGSTGWMQTGNLVDQTSSTGGNSATLNSNKTYTVVTVDGGVTSGLNFGNLCIGAGGGHTLGFWSNKNGQALTTSADLTMLAALNLRNANGSDFDPATKAALASWLLRATATNMAYMLSAQLAAMELNVAHGVNSSALIYAPGTASANSNGFATVAAVMSEANAALGADGSTPSGDPNRATQEALKNALDAANNNRTFVQPNASRCPAVPTA